MSAIAAEPPRSPTSSARARRSCSKGCHRWWSTCASAGCGLAVTTRSRSQVLPDVPSLAEFLPDYEASVWFGIAAPRNTPSGIVEVANRAINAGLADPSLKGRLGDLGATALPGSSAEFGALISHETEKWAKVVRATSLRPE